MSHSERKGFFDAMASTAMKSDNILAVCITSSEADPASVAAQGVYALSDTEDSALLMVQTLLHAAGRALAAVSATYQSEDVRALAGGAVLEGYLASLPAVGGGAGTPSVH